MCGIAGIWGAGDHRAEVSQMLDLLAHRGPDGCGVFTTEHGCIGSRRLAIMDPAHGEQPVIFGKNRALVANGEIYNHARLRSSLIPTPLFASESDTETIAWLFQNHGANTFPMLEGIFAVAIADEDKLCLARDGLGIKPLFYGSRIGKDGATQWVFASELQALRHAGIEPRALPPGNVFTPATGKQLYYQVPVGWQAGELQLDRTTEIRGALEASVESQLMSDVPIGVLLSGGLDSNLVAALAAKHIPNLYTFAVGLDRSPDLLAARQCARSLGSNHHEMTFTSYDIKRHLDKIVASVESWDRYIVRPAIPNYFAAQLAAKFVKVVLSGEGADELFAGYWYHKYYRSTTALHRELRRCVMNLHETNLQRLDRICMLHGVEARVPFLDSQVVEIGLSIDPRQKIRRPRPWSRRVEKYCLRRAFKGVLPDELLWRPKEAFNTGTGVDRCIDEMLGVTGKSNARDLEQDIYKKIVKDAIPHCSEQLDAIQTWRSQILSDGIRNPLTRKRPVLRMGLR